MMLPTWQTSAHRGWQVTASGATVTARDGYLEWEVADNGSLELFSRDLEDSHDAGGWGWTAVAIGWEDGWCRTTVTRRCGDCDGVTETVTDYEWRAGEWHRTYDRTRDTYAEAAGY